MIFKMPIPPAANWVHLLIEAYRNVGFRSQGRQTSNLELSGT